MTYSPVEEAQGRRIGTVEFTSPNEIKVSLDLDAPDNTALNSGNPRAFPRINNYLLIPAEGGFVVGQVEWLAIERSAFPKRRGLQDFGLIDLPFPSRKLSLNPVGTLFEDSPLRGAKQANASYSLKRGVYAFPTVGDPVLLPTDDQLRNIIESGQHRRILIGRAPLAGNAEVRIDPDRLFGRHLAVLGNTGSGKSCTVAGLIQWSLEEARSSSKGVPNARFIILDPNGEYTNVFKQGKVFGTDGKTEQLKVPLWFWNSEEWCSFVQASGKSQRPLLRRALREIRCGLDPLNETASEDASKQELRRYLSSQLITIRKERRSNSIKTEESKFGSRLKAIRDDLIASKDEVIGSTHDIEAIITKIDAALAATANDYKGRVYYRAFTEQQVIPIEEACRDALLKLGGIVYQEGSGENAPLPFDGAAFADHLEVLAEQENISQYVDTLIIRIRTMLADPQMRVIVGDSQQITLDGWLEQYLGDQSSGSETTVVDLSLIPSEIIHIVTAVIARMIFEGLQRYRMNHLEGKTLPTVLVMEEAHTFVRRHREDSEDPSSAATCSRVFERIAREGRKFGLGLVLSSQRPSELSQTVLSQCNSFILHRLSNDKDQEAVSKLLPDNLRSILRELPVLPSRYAFLLGWASELPILTHIRELTKKEQPQSADPDFWTVWTGRDEDEIVKRDADWRVIADRWRAAQTVSSEEELDFLSANEDMSSAQSAEDTTQFEDITDDDIPF